MRLTKPTMKCSAIIESVFFVVTLLVVANITPTCLSDPISGRISAHCGWPVPFVEWQDGSPGRLCDIAHGRILCSGAIVFDLLTCVAIAFASLASCYKLLRFDTGIGSGVHLMCAIVVAGASGIVSETASPHSVSHDSSLYPKCILFSTVVVLIAARQSQFSFVRRKITFRIADLFIIITGLAVILGGVLWVDQLDVQRRPLALCPLHLNCVTAFSCVIASVSRLWYERQAVGIISSQAVLSMVLCVVLFAVAFFTFQDDLCRLECRIPLVDSFICPFVLIAVFISSACMPIVSHRPQLSREGMPVKTMGISYWAVIFWTAAFLLLIAQIPSAICSLSIILALLISRM